jgi:glutaredoxin
MILVIGKENCSACDMTKTILKNKGIEFEYTLLDELEEIQKKEYIKLAREQGIMSMPLIIKEDKIIKLQEVIA